MKNRDFATYILLSRRAHKHESPRKYGNGSKGNHVVDGNERAADEDESEGKDTPSNSHPESLEKNVIDESGVNITKMDVQEP